MVLFLRYLHFLCLKTQSQISDKIQQISDIFQQNISDIFQQTDISMIKSGNRHFGHIQAYFFGLIQHAHVRGGSNFFIQFLGVSCNLKQEFFRKKVFVDGWTSTDAFGGLS